MTEMMEDDVGLRRTARFIFFIVAIGVLGAAYWMQPTHTTTAATSKTSVTPVVTYLGSAPVRHTMATTPALATSTHATPATVPSTIPLPNTPAQIAQAAQAAQAYEVAANTISWNENPGTILANIQATSTSSAASNAALNVPSASEIAAMSATHETITATAQTQQVSILAGGQITLNVLVTTTTTSNGKAAQSKAVDQVTCIPVGSVWKVASSQPLGVGN